MNQGRVKKLLNTILLVIFVIFSEHIHGGQYSNFNDFKIKGFHIDLRVQVMTMPELKKFALKLSKNGVNTLLMEWEATYPYETHRIISNQYAYTREEIKSFIAYCNDLKINVIPLQQSFGHVEYILKHNRYKALRQDQKDFSQVNPVKQDLCKALFTDLYKDLISTHTSPYIHIGGDETYILDKSPLSREEKGKIYGDYIRMLANLVISLRKRPVVWADIALKYPDALKDLPKEIIFIDWNYGWDLNRFGDHRKLMETGYEIWGSPAIRCSPDNYFLTTWNIHFENIKTFIPQARQLGYKGIIMTSWSTSGLYSPIFESATEIIDIPAVRRVYPLTGFNMIIQAYFESLKSTKPLDIDAFITKYSRDIYGFNEEQAKQFWKALTTVPYEINYGKVSRAGLSIQNLKDSSLIATKQLYRLKPVNNIIEYQHYLLMADIRDFYLTCMWVEDEMNREDYDRSKSAGLLAVLDRLPYQELNKRFIALQKHAYYLTELETENLTRNIRYLSLRAKLENERCQKIKF